MVFISDFVSAIILAVVQGLTEWFPVSSSGHLVFFERILDYSGGLLFEVAVHFGTLMAVFVYFGKEITEIIRDFITGKWDTENGKMGLLLIVASIPVAIVGFFAKDFFDTVLTNLVVVAFGFGITGLLLIIASVDSKRKFDLSKVSHSHTKSKLISNNRGLDIDDIFNLSYTKAFLIGIAQAVAIVPGISRSGATISSGVLLGLNEKNAMKFSFILSIPAVFGANIITIGNQTLPSELIWATLVSFLVGLLSIHLVFKYFLTKRKNFRWFAAYALLIALVLLFLIIIF